MIPVIRVRSAARFESQYSAILPGDLLLTAAAIAHCEQSRVLLSEHDGRNVQHGVRLRVLPLTSPPRPHRPPQSAHHQIAALHVQLGAPPAQRAALPTTEPYPPLLRQLRLILLPLASSDGWLWYSTSLPIRSTPPYITSRMFWKQLSITLYASPPPTPPTFRVTMPGLVHFAGMDVSLIDSAGFTW